MARAGIYNLLNDYGDAGRETHNGTDPYWIVAVIRLGAPLSFNRQTYSSSSKDLSKGALLRAEKPLIITDACLRIQIQNAKSSHTKTMNISLKPDAVNYLVEVLPDDWVFAWMVNNRDDYESLLSRIEKSATANDASLSCNRFKDGLKFVGRVDDIYKTIAVVDPNRGTKSTDYQIKCTAFRELETQLFYDYALASKDAGSGDFGWLARFGVSLDALFQQNSKTGISRDNVNLIIPKLLDLVLGKGPSRKGNIGIKSAEGTVSATPTLDHGNDPEYSYLVPVSVGNLLGRTHASKGIMSYADIMDLWTGVQSYSQKASEKMFTPDFQDNDRYVNRKRTKMPLLGTYLPFMPDFANRPIWQVFQQYVNHAINEIYTALKVNEDGLLVPTIVFRQIPFTTDAFTPPKTNESSAGSLGSLNGKALEGPAQLTVKKTKVVKTNTTKFLDLPRWHIPAALVKRCSVGRSNATRTNFIHIYGTSSYLAKGGTPIQNQIINNKPVADSVDIMRSGIRPYMTTVDCWVDDTVGKVPAQWMALVADWTIGSHLTLNGSIELYGVQAPIAEGDNCSFDGVIYHIMSVTHMASMDPNGGHKNWSTVLQVTNGMRNTDALKVTSAHTENDMSKGLQPIYPGFDKLDNTLLDGGLTVEHGNPTSGGDSVHKFDWDSPEGETEREGKSQLNPNDVRDAKERADLKSQQSFEEDLAAEKNLKGLL